MDSIDSDISLSEDDDDEILQKYREERLKQLKSERFGGLYTIEKRDFIREVTEASKDCFIIVFLHQE